MVQRETDACTPIVQKRDIRLAIWLPVLLAFLVVTGVALGILIATHKPSEEVPQEPARQEELPAENVVIVPTTGDDKPARIDFQPVVDTWVAATPGTRSVLIYDLERDEIAGEYNPVTNYATASLYKLFVVYEGYRRLQSGEWARDDPAGYTGKTILECLDLAIRVSDSSCGETLWQHIGRNELDQIIENDFGITDSAISSLASNPQDVAKMMRIFYDHKDITDEDLLAQMKDAFLNQPVTEYDWRQGLPKGFKVANVYNKVGWEYDPDAEIWDIYHDAAIVEFPEQNRHFIVVVMTNYIWPNSISELGSEIETEFTNAGTQELPQVVSF